MEDVANESICNMTQHIFRIFRPEDPNLHSLSQVEKRLSIGRGGMGWERVQARLEDWRIGGLQDVIDVW